MFRLAYNERMRNTSSLLLIATLALTGACGSDPVDAAGDYTIAVTNRENGCEFDNWVEGNSAANIGLVITQDGENASGTITGATGGFLDLILGSHVYQGTVDGNDIDMTIFGTRSAVEGNCTYTINSTVAGSLSGDVLTGNIRYEAATNGNPDCASLTGCSSRQEFNGTRPPQ